MQRILSKSGIAACSKPNNKSELNITSGYFVKKTDLDVIPAVPRLQGCTSTIVSDTTLITAAHCTQTGSQVCIIENISGTPYAGKCTNNVFNHKNFNGMPPDFRGANWGVDVSVAIFPRGTFKHYFKVSPTQLAIGMKNIMVGYSRTDLDAQGGIDDKIGAKRWGTNTVKSFEPGTNSYYSTNSGNANGVSVSPGDSGGPLFNDQCELVGVTSRWERYIGSPSKHTNLSANRNLEWLRTLELQGAYYCGLSGLDPTRCGENLVTPRPKGTKNKDGSIAFPCAGEKTDGTAPQNGIAVSVKNENGSVALEIAAPSHSRTVSFCTPKTNVRDCNASDTNYVLLSSPVRTENGKSIYKVPSTFPLSSQLVFAAIAADEKNQVTALRKFQISKK